MVAKYDNGRLRLLIFLDENAAHRSGDTKQVEIIFSDVLAFNKLRFISRVNAKLLRAGDRRHPFETMCLFSIVEVVGIRDWRAQPDQTVLLLHDWKRTNEDSVDDTEDRRV